MATTKGYVYVGSDRVVAGPGNYVFILLEASSQSAYLSGVAAGAEASDSTPVYLRGAEEVASSKSAFLEGNLDNISSVSAYLAGHILVTDSQDVFIYGEDSVLDTQDAYLHGNQVITSSQICYLEGYLPPADQKSSISGFLVGDGEWPFIDDFTGLDEDEWSTEKWITNVPS